MGLPNRVPEWHFSVPLTSGYIDILAICGVSLVHPGRESLSGRFLFGTSDQRLQPVEVDDPVADQNGS